MSFRNPIASGGGALVREAIKSPNYPPDGWSINRDGSATFGAGVVVRGSVRSIQPARKIYRSIEPPALASGSYLLDGLDTTAFNNSEPAEWWDFTKEIFVGGTSGGSPAALIAPRRAVYTVTAGARISPAAAATFGLAIRRGTSDEMNAGVANDVIGDGGSLPTGTHNLSTSVPVLLEASEWVWAVLFVSQGFTIRPGEPNCLAMSYLSEAP